jgi:hypothetical protein
MQGFDLEFDPFLISHLCSACIGSLFSHTSIKERWRPLFYKFESSCRFQEHFFHLSSILLDLIALPLLLARD